jgi:branched-chain amino acid transport system ATP-binding protein
MTSSPERPSEAFLLDVVDLHVSYGTASVLNGVTLHVEPGELVGLAGRNGAGKTTLLRTISGLVAESAGFIKSVGVPLSKNPEGVVRAGIAHVPEGRQVFATLTVEENLRAAAQGAGRLFDDADRVQVLDLFPPLSRLMGRKAGFLSGGEQQMVALSRGIVAHPRLLMIDELSLGLAPRLVSDIWTALRSLSERGLALFVVDQNIRTLRLKSHRLYLLDDGLAGEASSDGSREAELRALYFD